MPPDDMRAARPVRLSAAMVAKDAESTIADALLSLRFCDEIIVIVDASSTDRTEAIARSFTPHVEVRPWEGFASAKRYAVSRCRGEWVLMIDADEAVTPPLSQSIIEVVAADGGGGDGFAVRRRTRFLGRWITHGDWGRDRVFRLVRRSKAVIADSLIHESFQAPGRIRLLDGLLLHHGERTIDEHLARVNRYTSLAAQQMFNRGRRAPLWGMLTKPPLRFLRSYIFRLGLLDGWPGFVLAWSSTVYDFARFAKLRELHRRSQTS